MTHRWIILVEETSGKINGKIDLGWKEIFRKNINRWILWEKDVIKNLKGNIGIEILKEESLLKS